MSTLKTINVIHPSGTTNNIVNDASGNVAVGGTLTASTITSATATALTIKSAGTTAMTIDTSQNVGIGTISPAASLSIAKQTTALSGTGNSYGLYMYPTSSGLSYIDAITGSTGNTSLGFRTYNNGTYNEMRLDSSGNLLVGTTSTINGARLSIVGPTNGITVRNSNATGGLYWNTPYIDPSSNLYIINGSSVGVLLTNGATAWTANSDERLKDIIAPITSALEGVQSLRAVKYSWKSDEAKVPHIGLIAQDVQKVLPEVVSSAKLPQSTDGNEYLGVAYTEVIPLLVAAIQELSAKNDALEARLAALEAK